MPLHIPAGSYLAGFIDRSARNPAHLRIVFVVILTVIAIGMSLRYAAKVNKPGDSGQQTRSAFLRWRGMIHELFAGGNVYVGVHEYPNPPIMALALKPFGKYAYFLFSAGLFNASLFAASILPLSTAYAVCEGLGLEAGVNKRFGEAPIFYWLYTFLVFGGAAIVLIPKLPLLKLIL